MTPLIQSTSSLPPPWREDSCNQPAEVSIQLTASPGRSNGIVLRKLWIFFKNRSDENFAPSSANTVEINSTNDIISFTQQVYISKRDHVSQRNNTKLTPHTYELIAKITILIIIVVIMTIFMMINNNNNIPRSKGLRYEDIAVLVHQFSLRIQPFLLATYTSR